MNNVRSGGGMGMVEVDGIKMVSIDVGIVFPR